MRQTWKAFLCLTHEWWTERSCGSMVSGFAPTQCLAFLSMWLVCIWNAGDPNTILHSQERKLLDIRFLRDVDAEDARKA